MPLVLNWSADAPVAVLLMPPRLEESASSPRNVLPKPPQPSWQIACAADGSANNAMLSTSGIRSPATVPQWRDVQFVEPVVSEVFVFIKEAFPFPDRVNCATAGLNEGKKLSGEAPSPGFRP